MTPPEDTRTMHVQLTDERRAALVEALQHFTTDEFDVDLSEFQATRLLDFMVQRLGARIYNQAIQDARRFMLEKLEDLEGEFYEPEEQS